MTLLPKVKLKTLVSFPAAVYGGAGIAMVVQNGSYTFSIDFTEYPVVSSIPTPDLPNTNVLTYNLVSKAYLVAPYGGGGAARTLLSAAKTFYVSLTGNDANDGSVGSPWATIQHAIAVCDSTLDFGGQNVTIQLADGTYNQVFFKKQANVGGGKLLVQGNVSNPAAVTINVAAGNYGVFAATGADISIQNFTFTGASTGYFVAAFAGGTVRFITIVFGAGSPLAHFYCTPTGSLLNNGAYTISGSATYHVQMTGGYFENSGSTMTVTGAPAFTTFAYMQNDSLFLSGAWSGGGSVTGKKWDVQTNSVLNTQGQTIPGSIAGTTDGHGMVV